MNNNEQQINITPAGDQLVIRTGDANEVFDYQGYQYRAESTESLITLVKSKGSVPNSIIAYNQDGIKVILDDTVLDRTQDRLTYNYKFSQQFEEWSKILRNGAVFEQKPFIDFLRRREATEIDCQESLMAAIQNFKYVSNITGDFTYDDRNNYTFGFKIGDAEGTVKIPQIINANIEIYNESQFIQAIEIEIEVKRPKSEGEKPLFALTCPKLERYIKIAIENEIERVKTELEGYLIVAGVI
jgi:hypothetical protein